MICRECGKVVPYTTGSVPGPLGGLCTPCLKKKCESTPMGPLMLENMNPESRTSVEVAKARAAQEQRRQGVLDDIAMLQEVQDRTRAEREEGADDGRD